MKWNFKINHKRLGGESIRQTYLRELELKGLICYELSPLDKRAKLWQPTDLDEKKQRNPQISNSCTFSLSNLETAWNELRKCKIEPTYIKYNGSRLDSVRDIAFLYSDISTSYFRSNIHGDNGSNPPKIQLNRKAGYSSNFEQEDEHHRLKRIRDRVKSFDEGGRAP